MTKPNSTEIIVILDRSGSMVGIKKDMEGGFNHLIEEQKKVPGECKVTLAQFDDEYEVVYTCKDIQKVPKLDLQPRNMTALLDAIGRTIQETGNRLANMKEEDRPSQVVTVIITDGFENSSREYNRQRVHDMITHQREKYSWEFIFLGANQDAIATAQDLGISATNSVTYDASAVGTAAVYNSLSRGISRYRSSGKGQMENIIDQEEYDNEVEIITPKSS